jgi:tripartite-type tricarboxylate transporter receptor subunit TctC
VRHIVFTSYVVCVIIGMSALIPAWAEDADPFRGKEISMLIGTGPAGGYDVSGRLFARHYGRFLPGNPSVIPRNVPGASGLRLANQIYNVSPKDGTELGLFPTVIVLQPLWHNHQAKFETANFNWIGNMDSYSANGCGTWRHSGIKTWEDLKTRETTFGSAGSAGQSSSHPKVISALLDLRTKVILGYTSTQDVILAMQRGEVDGSCALNVQLTASSLARQIAAGDLTVWITFGKERVQEFPDAPTIYELVKNEDDRQVAELVFGQNQINRAISAPPGVRADRVAILRAAFMATMADKTFLEDAVKANVSIRPMTGEQTAQVYQSFYNKPKSVVERTISIMGATSE